MLYIITALKCEAAALGGLPGEVIVTGVGGRVVDRIKQLDLKPDDYVLNVAFVPEPKRVKATLSIRLFHLLPAGVFILTFSLSQARKR